MSRTTKKRAKDRLAKRRGNALMKPITAEQHIRFKKNLLAIRHGDGFCWIHVAKSAGGHSRTYAKVKYNGFWIGAHRFALAVKLGCTLWDLEGFNAGHAPAWECMGGRCCNPDHLRKERTPEGSWARSKDAIENGAKPTRTPEQVKLMLKRMHPDGLPVGDMLLGRIVTFGRGRDAFQNRVVEPVHTQPKSDA